MALGGNGHKICRRQPLSARLLGSACIDVHKTSRSERGASAGKCAASTKHSLHRVLEANAHEEAAVIPLPLLPDVRVSFFEMQASLKAHRYDGLRKKQSETYANSKAFQYHMVTFSASLFNFLTFLLPFLRV
ncbi:hypothetical protein BV22DRAFT_262590 [Leucogyrophana mollusca]|uniref:Uncharacterized protein n=1 Tax=Leucogyrophana mollusca TaxID=85980 RepID=A0ACB8BPZ5_9AGAM|nr:hypothetical protein BV22DRAFT_262590 [Leucogyrophana mollusca]